MDALYKVDGVLLQHETAYCIGQMYTKELNEKLDIISYLKQIVMDKSMNPVTRHEAGESLCHTKDESLVDFLKQMSEDKDEPDILRETC